MRKLLFGLVAASLALSTATARVTTDSDPSAQFSTYRTFYWAEKPETPSPLTQQRIVDGINARLQAKGWTLGETGDIALAAHVTTSQRQTLDTFYTGGTMGGWGWRGWGGMGTATTTVRTYNEGTLVVDMFDTRTRQAVWRGTATETISSSPDKVVKKITKVLDKMFKDFPPQAGSD